MRIVRDVEDAATRARGGSWNGFKANPSGLRATETVVRGETERQSLNRSGGTEGNGLVRRDGVTPASSARGSTIGGADNRGRMVRNLPYPEFLKTKEEGRCFRCGGPFGPGHHCPEKSLSVIILTEDEQGADEEKILPPPKPPDVN